MNHSTVKTGNWAFYTNLEGAKWKVKIYTICWVPVMGRIKIWGFGKVIVPRKMYVR